MSPVSNGITLQFNLSPGDVSYASITVPALARAHRSTVDRTIAVVDLCRPQRTKIVDPETRFPAEAFGVRCERIRSIANDLVRTRTIDEVFYLTPGDGLVDHLSARFTNGWIRETHDYGGCALMAYFAALDLPSTRYVLHYDADMLLHQAPGFDWAVAARDLLERDPTRVAATPRCSPPFTTDEAADGSTRVEHLPRFRVQGGWVDSWFSTRCFLMDLTRLKHFLPLISGRTLLELLAVKYLGRGYPRSPEIMLFRRVGFGGGWHLTLSDQRAWLLHPATKPPEYLELLPRILEHVARGEAPSRQLGNSDVDIDAWRAFISGSDHPAVAPARAPDPSGGWSLRSLLRSTATRALWGPLPRPSRRA